MLRVGLTGGIACGKSRVLRRFQAAGCHVLDLDDVSRQVMAADGTAFSAIVEHFGRAILAANGSIDRTALGRLAFSNPEARASLNALVHPRIREVEEAFASRFATEPGAVVVTDGALLVETGLHARYDRLVVVYCSAEEQLRRLQVRDGLNEADARARIAVQMPQDEKRAYGHYTVSTSGTPEETDQRADALAAELRRLALTAESAGAGIEPPH
jgi:dephospho-CoA kinase